MSRLIAFKSLFRIKQPVFFFFLLVRTGRSISMGSKCNTDCQITASIIESYALVPTSNQGFARIEAMLAR